MNEKIRKLALQAGLYDDYVSVAGVISVVYPDLEKFAELIVKECANLLDPDGEYSEKFKYSHTPGPNGLRTILPEEHFYEMKAANKLKKHFGVEE